MSKDKEKRPVGRPKAFKNPEELAEIFEAYKKHVKANPRLQQMATPSGIVTRELECPYSFAGFDVFLFNSGKITTLEHYLANTDDAYTEFLGICSRIKREIRMDQIEGGMVGQYNASITQRLNGLTEKTENKTELEIPQLVIRQYKAPENEVE